MTPSARTTRKLTPEKFSATSISTSFAVRSGRAGFPITRSRMRCVRKPIVSILYVAVTPRAAKAFWTNRSAMLLRCPHANTNNPASKRTTAPKIRRFHRATRKGCTLASSVGVSSAAVRMFIKCGKARPVATAFASIDLHPSQKSPKRTLSQKGGADGGRRG